MPKSEKVRVGAVAQKEDALRVWVGLVVCTFVAMVGVRTLGTLMQPSANMTAAPVCKASPSSRRHDSPGVVGRYHSSMSPGSLLSATASFNRAMSSALSRERPWAFAAPPTS